MNSPVIKLTSTPFTYHNKKQMKNYKSPLIKVDTGNQFNYPMKSQKVLDFSKKIETY